MIFGKAESKFKSYIYKMYIHFPLFSKFFFSKMTTEFLLTRLSKDIGKLINFNDEYNVIIKVGISPNQQEFKAHSLILRARSPYFQIALSNDWIRTREDNIIRLEKPNISPNIFEAILRYAFNV